MAGPVTQKHDKKYPKILVRQRGTQMPSENKRWCCVCQFTKVSDRYIVRSGPVSWSSGQGLLLLIMRSRVRSPVLPWEFFLAGKDSRGDHGLGS